MKIDLNRDDLINLANSISPHHSVMDDERIMKNGSFKGTHGDRWEWKYNAFLDLSEEEIWSIYQICKASWE